MKAILLLAALVLVAVTCGWLTFNHADGKVSAQLNSTEMKQDVREAVETVEKKAKDGIEEIESRINE